MDAKTELLHTKVDISGAKPNVTPLFQCSSFLSDSDYFYTRKSNPNSVELEEVFSKLESCGHALAVTTGMTAIHLVLGLLKPGDHLIANQLIYGCTYRLFSEFADHYGIDLDFVDLTQAGEWEKALRPATRMILFETPTNPLLKTVSIRSVSEAAKNANPECLVVVDNTWATPHFQKPLQLGADICIASATKFYSGHSDCMGGVITTDRVDLAEKMAALRFYRGAILDPHSAWLIRRSMQTFHIRMQEHQRKAQIFGTYLAGRPEVERVFLPEVDGQQLQGYGGILFFELRAMFEDRVAEFMTSLRLFERGTSMACIVSAVAQPYTGSHLSMNEAEKARVGIKKTLVRLCFGLEDEKDLKSDLDQAFDLIRRGMG